MEKLLCKETLKKVTDEDVGDVIKLCKIRTGMEG